MDGTTTLPEVAASPAALVRLVEAAAGAVEEHDGAVQRIVAASARQRAAIEALTGATAQAASAADAVALHASELSSVADRLPEEIASTRAALDELERSLRLVADSIQNGRGVTERLDAGWRGVGDAVDEIARAARRARVLAVNASIEAAYVDSAGSGFAIVAERMRALSASTLDASRDVRGIVTATRSSAGGVVSAIDAAVKSCSTVANALAAAGRDFDAAGGRAGFGDAISRIASIADEQRVAGTQIAASVERLRLLAADVATAAQRASRGIDEGVARARFALDTGTQSGIEDAVDALTSMAIAAAQGGSAWRGVDEALDALATEFSQVAAALEESALAAHTLDAAADDVAATLAQYDRGLQSAADAFDRAAADVTAAHEHGTHVRGGIVAMHAATDRAGTIVDAVSDISSESGLLAINAAIEAARAGDRGLGFTVIADEIGHLARGTQQAAEEIADTIGTLRSRGERFERASHEGSAQMDAVVSEAANGKTAVDRLRATIAASVERSRGMRETSRVLSETAQHILIEVASAREALHMVGRDARERARLALSDLLNDAHHVGEALGLDSPIAHWHRVIGSIAEQVEAVYADAIATGRTTLDGLRDTAYVELQGREMEHLSRFADVRTAPRNGFVPAKYRTSSDAAVDREVTAIFDRTIASEPRIGSMGAFDLNGFAIALPSAVCTITDWQRNRAKRLFEDPIMLRMARTGLGAGAEGSGLRRPWSAFDRDGYALRRVTPRPWAPLAYLQDTGDVFINVATAVYVGDVRVGTVSLIVRADVIRT